MFSTMISPVVSSAVYALASESKGMGESMALGSSGVSTPLLQTGSGSVGPR